ncbi:MAG: alkaline phosphatase family protein [bacterium]|nr:alkaline phosphatase family protein [bacterium]
MKEIKYSSLRHLTAGINAGLLFSLAVGVIFGLKMIGINEAMHVYRYAYPFMLNFIPLYLLLGLIFGAFTGIIGGLLLRKTEERQGLRFWSIYGICVVAFLVPYFIFGVPIGPIVGMILATIILITAHGVRPKLVRLYFAVFFTSISFNYSWQWVRKHFIVNPFVPNPASRIQDLLFTIVWAMIFILGFRIFLKALLRLPARLIYLIGGGVVAASLLLGGVFYLIKSTPAATVSPTGNVQIERVFTNRKVLLIGIDGLWWRVIDPLLQDDRLPNLKKLIDSGSSGQMETLFPTFSAAIWTSITTGKNTDKHGVTSFLVWKFPWSGLTVPCFLTPKITQEMDFFRNNLIIEAPITNQFLDAVPIWLMLSDHGASVGTVNWWVSWPADSVNGFVVTDHALYNKSDVMQNYKRKEGVTIYDVYPPELLSELQGFSHSPNDLTEQEIRRFINVDSQKFLDDFYAIDTYNYLDIAYEASMFKYSYPEDVTFAGAAKYLIQTRQPEFTCVYLKGMDSMEHQYLKYYFASDHPDKLLPKNRERYKDLINNYYIYMDEVIGSLVDAADSNTVVMVVSDHGFDEVILPTGHYNHMNAPPAVFICAGPGIRKDFKVDNAQVYDVVPTVLHLLGFPVAEDFDGKVLTDIMSDDNPINRIPTYETGKRAARTLIQSEIDENYKDRLKALGYTQ